MTEQGFGCMGFSAFYSSAAKSTDENAIEVFREAVKSGVSLFNTATFYGPLNVNGYGTNLRLIKKCLVGMDRSKIQLMVKVGMDTRAPVESTGRLIDSNDIRSSGIEKRFYMRDFVELLF